MNEHTATFDQVTTDCHSVCVLEQVRVRRTRSFIRCIVGRTPQAGLVQLWVVHGIERLARILFCVLFECIFT